MHQQVSSEALAAERIMTLCDCEWLDQLGHLDDCPIHKDTETGVYWLCLRDFTAVLRFCPSCGGRLPCRDSLFIEFDQLEVQEARDLFLQTRTLSDVLRVFGEPDQKRTFDENAPQVGEFRATNEFRYTSRWKTLKLSIFERSDQSLVASYQRRRGPDVPLDLPDRIYDETEGGTTGEETGAGPARCWGG